MKSALVNRLLSAGYIRDSEKGNPLVIVLRMLAIPIVVFSLYLKIHPNIVTCISLVLGCLGAVFYYMGLSEAFILAWSLSVVLDYTDGTIARKSGKESHFGYLFDMLGDRLKLVSLVIAWWLVEGDLLVTLLAALIVLILIVTEIITHLFVQHVSEKSVLSAHKRGVFYQVFLHFHMHSFFIYGLALYIGGVTALMTSAWLVLIMLLDLRCEVQARLFQKGKISVHVNDKCINKINRRFFKSEKK